MAGRNFYIRGIGLSDASVWNTNPIGTYLDDVYIWNASTVGFPLFDLERVEVLRGPQGTLWGKNTTGGAINFISRKPTFDTDGYAKLSYGNYHNSVFEGAVGGAIKDDVLAARVSIHREDSDRYAQNSFVPGTERWSDLGVRTQFLAKFSSTFEALLNIHYRDFNGPVLQSGTTACRRKRVSMCRRCRADRQSEAKGQFTDAQQEARRRPDADLDYRL